MDSLSSQLVFDISVPSLIVHSNPISETLDRGLGLLQSKVFRQQVVTAVRPHSHSHPQQYHGSVCLSSDALLLTWFEEDAERSHSEVFEYCDIYGARLISNAHLPEAQIFASTGTFDHQRSSNSKAINGSNNTTSTQSSAKKSKPDVVYEYHSPIFDINGNASFSPPTFTSSSPPPSTAPQLSPESSPEQQPPSFPPPPPPADSSSVGVSLYTFAEPRPTSRTRNSSHRSRQVKTLFFSGPDLELNKLQAYRFCHELRRRIALFHAAEASNWPAYYPEQRFTRPVLFLLNPRGGSGRALELFKNVINPALYEAGIEYSLFITARAGHACEFVRSADLSHFYGLCIISGDGLIHEVVNGLMWRPDWADAIRKPMGFLPAGSGNGLIASLLYSVGERFEAGTLLAHALYMFLKHVPFPHDLARIECQCSSSSAASSAVTSSGAASSVAATSGTGAAGGSAGLVSGAVPFSTAAAFAPPECSPSSSSSTSSGARDGQGQGQANGAQPCANASASATRPPTRTLWSHLAFSWAFIAEVDIESEILRFIGGARFKVYSIPKILQLHAYRGRMTFLPVHPYSGRCTATSEFTSDHQSLYVARESEQLPHVQHEREQEQEDVNGESEELGLARFAPRPPRDWPRLHYVPPLHEAIELRGGWTVIEDDFVALSVAYCSHLSSDTIVAPDKRIGYGDGLMYLVMVRGGVSRLELVRLLLHSFGAASDGSAKQQNGQSGTGNGSDKQSGRSHSGSEGVAQRSNSKSPGRGGGSARTTSDPTDGHRIERRDSGPSTPDEPSPEPESERDEPAFVPGANTSTQGLDSAPLEVIPIRAFRFEPLATCPRVSASASNDATSPTHAANTSDGRRSKTVVGCEENARVARDRPAGPRLSPSKSAAQFSTPPTSASNPEDVRARDDSSAGLTDGQAAQTDSSCGACRHQSIDVSRVIEDSPPFSTSAAEKTAAEPTAAEHLLVATPTPSGGVGGETSSSAPPSGSLSSSSSPATSGARGTRSAATSSSSASSSVSGHPHPPGGIILTVDGERIEYGAVQGELVPRLAVFMGLPLPPAARGEATAADADCN